MVLAGSGLLALVVWEGTLPRFSPASRESVAGTIAALAALAVVAGRGAQRTSSATWARTALGALRRTGSTRLGRPGAVSRAGAAAWVLLVAVTIGWDLTSFVAQVRWLPTLSRLAGDVTGRPWGRSVVFAAWFLLGASLALGSRVTQRRRAAAPSGRPDVGTEEP